ncbi:hypothetical protein GCM10022384_19460 [Streptomyces marokkonensis]|uniref:Uncharacterized protein n=2 Tax=Streptomyces marokkonensis TaxID=324855 RepID=A0ABP7PP44_9ACTN
MRQETVCEPGAAVFDNASLMVGVVRDQRGPMLILIRPSGLCWQTRAISVRPVDDRERIQLAALARHHQQARTLAKLRRRVSH